jgi:hypothetical protein
MVRVIFRLLTPLMFFFAVIVYIADFRLMAIPFAAAGYLFFLIAQELSPSR